MSCSGDVPIACSLSAEGLADRVAEWRSFVGTHVVTVDAEADTLRLTLDESPDALTAAASLGRREKACCPFFSVAIDLQPDAAALRLSVPAGAETVLAEFAELVNPGAGRES